MTLRRIFITTTSFGFAAFIIISILAPAAHAAPASSSAQALEIGPPALSFSANPGTTVKSELKLRNISSSTMTVSVDVNDFTANQASESGDPRIILDRSEPNPYSMIEWFKPFSQLTLQSRQLVSIPVSISIPKNAVPGGYYAAVRFTGHPADLSGTGVSLSASIASLVLLKVNGAAKEAISIEDFSVRQSSIRGTIFESTPIEFSERLKNSGNLHEQPTGYATIKDMFGKTVANLSVNADQRNVLPQSIRKFEQSLDSQAIGDKVLFGRYTAELKLTYGAKSQEITKRLSFWVIPYRMIGIAIILIIVAILIMRIAIRRYNERLIERSRSRRRRR